MNKTTLYIGLNDKDTKTQILDDTSAVNIVTTLLNAHGVNGATVYKARGVYKHENGDIIIENTLRVEIIEPAVNLLTGAIISIKKALNQEAIIKQVENITSDFV